VVIEMKSMGSVGHPPKTVSNTKQLRIQKEAAQQSGKQHELHTGTNTTLRDPLLKEQK
jgi:hypothetical protein